MHSVLVHGTHMYVDNVHKYIYIAREKEKPHIYTQTMCMYIFIFKEIHRNYTYVHE